MARAVPDILLLESDYQAGARATAGPNPGFIGNTLYASSSAGTQLFAPGYKSPYALNWNFGIQQELKRGVVVTADYVHNASLRIGQAHDTNHVGDARYINVPAAQAAIASTLGQCGVTSVGAAVTACPGLHTNKDGSVSGATIGDFAANGLDSINSYTGGAPATAYGLTYGADCATTTGCGAAFPGINPLVGTGSFQFPRWKVSL